MQRSQKDIKDYLKEIPREYKDTYFIKQKSSLMQKIDGILMNQKASDYNKVDVIKASNMIQKQILLVKKRNIKLNK